MKIINLLFIVLILSACTSPQTSEVSKTSEVSATPPPTETLIPTPTLHPQFIELQNLFASSERYILLPDGTIEEQTVDGGQQSVPNLHVDPNGVINIIFNNEHVLIEPSQISFDENGLTIKGYEQNENGDWVEVQQLFTLDQIATLTPEEKLEYAIAIDGYSAYRTAERYVFYENAEGKRDVAYDLTTGEQVSIPEYPICTPELFYNCEIPQEDLMNGKYWLWLNTLDVEFDPEKIKDVPIVAREMTYGGWIKVTEIYHDSGYDKPADFADPATAPFDRDVTSGVVIYEKDGGAYTFGNLRPVAFFDRQTKQVNWVVTLESFYDPRKEITYDPQSSVFSPGHKTWKSAYNVTPIMTGFYSLNSGGTDPVLENTYKTYSDMGTRFAQFIAGDMSALSAPGLVVQTGSNARPTDNRYK